MKDAARRRKQARRGAWRAGVRWPPRPVEVGAMRNAAFAGLAVALLVAPVRAGVLRVSPAGPTDFHQIQDAVTAAVDGDIILVEPGEYAAFTVADKALDIEADGGPCTVKGLIAITAVAPGKAVVVR